MSHQPQFVPPAGGPAAHSHPFPAQPYAAHPLPAQPYAAQPFPAQPFPATAQPAPTQVDQRPAVIGMAATLCVTASLLWIGALSLAWLFALAGEQALADSGSDVDTRAVLLLNHFSARLLDGLAIPLYLIPLASAVVGFLVLVRAQWGRLAFTAMGVLALAWTAWWLRSDLIWFVVPAAYIAITVLIVWTPAASRWYRGRVG